MQVGDSIGQLRQAAVDYPFSYMFRSAAALRLGNVALQQNTEVWQLAALPELQEALKVDPYAPDLLALAITNDLALNRVKSARLHYRVFKSVAKKSYLIKHIQEQRKE